MVPNIDGEDHIETYESARGGRKCKIPAIRRSATQRIQTLHENSMPVLGARLFNCLPKDVREFGGTLETFKVKVDLFLRTIPDKPCLPHYYQNAQSNSIIKQIEQTRANML